MFGVGEQVKVVAYPQGDLDVVGRIGTVWDVAPGDDDTPDTYVVELPGWAAAATDDGLWRFLATELVPLVIAETNPPVTDTTNPKDLLGVKKAPLRFVPPALALAAAGAMAQGAEKYGPFNWRQTQVRTTAYLEAIERHLMAYRDGQDNAEDSGVSHLGHIAACVSIILDAEGVGTLVDDRPTPGPAPAMLRALDRTLTPA